MKNVKKKPWKEKMVGKTIKEKDYLEYLTLILLVSLILNSFILVTIKFVDLNSVFTSVVSFSQTISSDNEPAPPAPEPTPSPIPSPPSSGNGGGSAGIFEIFPPSTNQIPGKNGTPVKKLLPSKQPSLAEPAIVKPGEFFSPPAIPPESLMPPPKMDSTLTPPTTNKELVLPNPLPKDYSQKDSPIPIPSPPKKNLSSENLQSHAASPETIPETESKKLPEVTFKILTMEEAIFFLLGIEIVLIVALFISTLMLYRKKLRH